MSIDPVATVLSPLPRAQLSEFLPTPRAVKTFESLQSDSGALVKSVNEVIDKTNAIAAAPVVTTAATAAFDNESVLTDSSEIAVDLATGSASFSLIATTVTADTYGDASHVVRFTVDAKGRLTGSQQIALNSDNVTEGTTNLFFTQTRARASISGIGAINYDPSTGVISHGASGVTAGTYANPTSITVDAYGHVTAIS